MVAWSSKPANSVCWTLHIYRHFFVSILFLIGMWQYICESNKVAGNICYGFLLYLLAWWLLGWWRFVAQLVLSPGADFCVSISGRFGVIGLPIYVCEMPYQCAGLRDAAGHFCPTIMRVARLIVLVPLLSWESALVDRKVIDNSIEVKRMLVFCLITLNFLNFAFFPLWFSVSFYFYFYFSRFSLNVYWLNKVLKPLSFIGFIILVGLRSSTRGTHSCRKGCTMHPNVDLSVRILKLKNLSMSSVNLMLTSRTIFLIWDRLISWLLKYVLLKINPSLIIRINVIVMLQI